MDLIQTVTPPRRRRKPKQICVYFSKAAAWRKRGHVHWFVCKRCLGRIARGLKP